MTQVLPAGIHYTATAAFEDDVAVYFTEIKGDLLCYAGEEEESPVVAGRIQAYYIDVSGAESEGYSLFELFDTLQEGSECYQLLYDAQSEELAATFLAAFEETVEPNVLLLQRLEVLPSFRGARLGLAAIHRTIQQFGHGCGYVVLKPVPLQIEPIRSASDQHWRKAMALERFPADIDAGVRRLRAYYGLLGFRLIPGSEWMALNLDFVRPSLADVGFFTP